MDEDTAHDVVVDPPDGMRRWSIEEQKRVDEMLEKDLERKWSIDDRYDPLDHFSAPDHARAIDERAFEEAVLYSTRRKFLQAWAAFEDTHYGKILTDNPDMAAKLKGLLLKCFA